MKERKFRMNLQLFPTINNGANGTVSAGSMGTGTANTDLTPEMKTFYDMTLIDEASPELVHDQFGQKRPIPAHGGKTIEFRKFAPYEKATTPLDEGVTPTGKTLNVTAITSTCNQYGDYTTIDDVLELTAIDNVILETTKLHGRQAGLTLDTITRDVLHTGTNVAYCPTSGGTAIDARYKLDSTCALTVKQVQKAVAYLRAQNAKPVAGQDYVAIIHPYAAYDLMRDQEWQEWNKYTTPEAMFSGEIGRISNVRFVTSTEAKIYAGADLASNSRNLAVNGAITANTQKTITFDGGTVADHALKGRKIIVDGKEYTVADNTTTVITVDQTANLPAIADNTVIYPGEGGAAGAAVFATLFIADGAYGVTEIAGGGLQTIVKQKGSAGTADPLDQRSTIGWKAIKTAEILVDRYMVRVESCSPEWSASAQAN